MLASRGILALGIDLRQSRRPTRVSSSASFELNIDSDRNGGSSDTSFNPTDYIIDIGESC